MRSEQLRCIFAIQLAAVRDADSDWCVRHLQALAAANGIHQTPARCSVMHIVTVEGGVTATVMYCTCTPALARLVDVVNALSPLSSAMVGWPSIGRVVTTRTASLVSQSSSTRCGAVSRRWPSTFWWRGPACPLSGEEVGTLHG